MTVQKLHNTATVDQAVLATSNGRGGGSMGSEHMGSTSVISSGAVLGLRDIIPGFLAIALIGMGAAVVMSR